MYTGIIKGIGTVIKQEKTTGLAKLTIEFPSNLTKNIELGASIAIDGCCLTVTDIHHNIIHFQLIAETLERTTLGALKPNDKVNIERSLAFGDEVGGHVLSGHIHGAVKILDLIQPENNHIVTCNLPTHFEQYFFSKGFIALNGASLTLNHVDRQNGTFAVHLIPETLARTTFAEKTVGDKLNFEIDHQTQILVDTAERTAKIVTPD